MPAKFNELGRTGLKHFSGTLYEEFLPQLQGQKGYKIYEEMANNSPIIAATLFAIESLLRSVDWVVVPVSEDPADIEAAEFLDQCMQDMEHTWEDFISEVLTMLPYGWSYFETVYKRRAGNSRRRKKQSEYDDNRIGWDKFAIRGQNTLYRWELDKNGSIEGMWQFPLPTGPLDAPVESDIVFLPIDKCLLFRTTSTKNNPEGRSVLRSAYRPWYFGKHIEEIEAIGIERDLAGMPVAKVPLELLADDRTADQTATYNYIKDIVTRVKQDQQMGIIWPMVKDENGNDLYEFTLMNAEGKRAFNTGEIIQRYQQQQAMVVMADFILLGHENVGSFALSSDKTELFAVALGAWLDSIENVLNRHAVTTLFEMNDFGVEELPQIRHGDIEKPDLQALGDFITKMAQAGAPLFPDFALENHLREIADVPLIDPEEREEIMSQQAGMAGMGMFPMPGENAGGGGQRSLPSSPSPNQLPAPEAKSENIRKSAIRPRYFDGTRWKTLHGRHRFLKNRLPT